MRQMIALLGDEHPDLGSVAVETLGSSTAIALSAGRLPKAYWHLDPNEDGALAVAGGRCRLLAVADGHNGFDAAFAALNGVYQATGREPDDLSPRQILVRCLDAARGAVASALEHTDGRRSLSRTAVSIAVLGSRELCASTYGDTVVTRVRGRRLKRLTEDAEFLGPDSTPSSIASASLKAGDTVILASDGITDFLGRTWQQRFVEAAASREAPRVVRHLVDLAYAGGAGDHLSAAATVID